MKKGWLWAAIIVVFLILGLVLFLYVKPSLSPPTTQTVVLLIMAEDGEIKEVINTYLTRRCPNGFVIVSREVIDEVEHNVSFYCA